MSSSPTPACPTRSPPRAERWPRGAAALLLAALVGGAVAHGLEDHEADDTAPGVQLEGALALSAAHASQPWPAARLPGLFSNGDTPADRRGGALEHGTLALGLRADAQWSARLGYGWHDSDPAHVEDAWLQWQRPLGEGRLQLRGGRQAVPTGRVVAGGGHFDRFGAMPLAKRVVLGGDWIDDGLDLRWQRGEDDRWPWLQSLGVGVWRGRAYPGGAGMPWAPALQARVGAGGWQAQLLAMRLQPSRRGAYIQNALSGHTHARPDCERSLVGITCFDGRSDVLTLGLRWDTPWTGWTLQAAGLWRRDVGALWSASGDAHYRGNTGGGWLDVIWQPSDRWQLALRGEGVRGVQRVRGSGALAVATDAGLLGNQRVQRLVASAGYLLRDDLRASVEAGVDRIGSERESFAALRLVWTPGALWRRDW